MTLRNLDVAIALAVVMLGVSLLITVLTQILATGLAARGRTLRDALAILFKTVCPEGAAHAEAIANDVLTHELISDSAMSSEFNGLTVLKNYRLATALRVEELIGILNRLASAAPPNPGAQKAAEIILKSDGIKAWFNSAMDRASQKFILKMRVITVVCSVVVAFALHLDTFRLISDVSADPELRAGLVTASQAIQAQAGQERQGINVPAAYPAALRRTADALHGQSPALAGAAVNIPAYLASREAGEQWLRTKMNGDPKLADALATYQGAVNDGLKSDTDRLLDHAASIRSSLGSAGFRLIPDPYHGWDFWPATKGYWPWDNLHFWGILFSAGLLSLGAPFWFNALKTLSSLRPAVASKIEQR